MKYNSIGEQLVAKAKELDPSYKPDKFNDMSEAINIILNNSGANNFIELEFNIRDIIDEESGLLNLDTFDFTLPANTLSEEMFGELALNKKEGFKLKFYFLEEEYGKIYYANIIAYPIAESFYSTNIVNMLGIPGYWSGSIDDVTIDNVFHFNKLGSGNNLDKIWYELPSLFFLENITQEQFDEIKNLALQNQLAGINCAGLYCPLIFYNDGQNITFFYPWYENDIFTAQLIILDTDLSVKKTPYSTITLPQTAPTSQVIPSITTSNHQQNLTVGNGLTIENGVLKATGGSGGQSIEDLPVIELTSEITTITDETVKAKILENVNNDNYLICKLKMPHLSTIEILITRDAKLVPNDIIENTVFTQIAFINLGLVASTFAFTLSINSKDGTIAVAYELFDYVKSNQISLFQKADGAFGVTTDYGDTNNINGLMFYFDTINGKPIIHKDSAVNSYNIPTITFED